MDKLLKSPNSAKIVEVILLNVGALATIAEMLLPRTNGISLCKTPIVGISETAKIIWGFVRNSIKINRLNLKMDSK
tara:strand:- start:1790 stop:2017 length:228 start_codon:yes stop_codon:yes gene_type:complete